MKFVNYIKKSVFEDMDLKLGAITVLVVSIVLMILYTFYFLIVYFSPEQCTEVPSLSYLYIIPIACVIGAIVFGVLFPLIAVTICYPLTLIPFGKIPFPEIKVSNLADKIPLGAINVTGVVCLIVIFMSLIWGIGVLIVDAVKLYYCIE